MKFPMRIHCFLITATFRLIIITVARIIHLHISIIYLLAWMPSIFSRMYKITASSLFLQNISITHFHSFKFQSYTINQNTVPRDTAVTQMSCCETIRTCISEYLWPIIQLLHECRVLSPQKRRITMNDNQQTNDYTHCEVRP